MPPPVVANGAMVLHVFFCQLVSKIARCEVYLSIYIAYNLARIPTPWAAGQFHILSFCSELTVSIISLRLSSGPQKNRLEAICTSQIYQYLQIGVLIPNRDITDKSAEVVLLLHHIDYGVFRSVFRWPFCRSRADAVDRLLILGVLTLQIYHQVHGLEPPNVQNL